MKYNKRASVKHGHKRANRPLKKHDNQTTVYCRRAFLQRAYGITEADYERMFCACKGLCQICRRPETAKRNGRIRLLCVDHNHETKTVRGLLCSSCNRGVGYFADDPLRMAAAISYLEEAHGVH